MSEKLPETTFARRNPTTGLIEVIDMYTGNVLAVQRTALDLYHGPRAVMIKTTLPSGETIWHEQSIDPGVLPARGPQFNQLQVDLICQAIAEGGSLTKICKQPGMPDYTTICRWRRAHPHIEDQLEEARKDRGEYLRDLALEEAEAADSRDPLGASSLRVDTYMKLAGMDNGKYSPKAKVEATVNAPVQIIVNTGIERRKSVAELGETNQAIEAGTTGAHRKSLEESHVSLQNTTAATNTSDSNEHRNDTSDTHELVRR